MAKVKHRGETAPKPENIELSLPINAAYVPSARLTASSIADRLGYDIDEMEEIKSAVSEACNYIIRNAGTGRDGKFRVLFTINGGSLETLISCDGRMGPGTETPGAGDWPGAAAASALIDQMDFRSRDDGSFEISIIKSHKLNIFI